jgi:hypothetical protein
MGVVAITYEEEVIRPTSAQGNPRSHGDFLFAGLPEGS